MGNIFPYKQRNPFLNLSNNVLNNTDSSDIKWTIKLIKTRLEFGTSNEYKIAENIEEAAPVPNGVRCLGSPYEIPQRVRRKRSSVSISSSELPLSSPSA